MSTLVRDYLPTNPESRYGESVAFNSSWMVVPARKYLGLLNRWLDTAKQRRDLSRLSETQLKDIGITRVDALREASKPFWMLP